MKSAKQFRLTFADKEARDELVYDAWKTRKYKMTKLAMYFRLPVSQIFTIIKEYEESKAQNPI